MIEIVSATRFSKKDFWEKSALGRSLHRLAGDKRVTSFITFENRLGLSDVYNARINSAKSQNILVFAHDDVWLDDFFIADRLVEGLSHFDVIGLAGNRRRVPRQPAWLFIDDKFTWDNMENLSGSVAHGAFPFGPVARFGPVPCECELLDGVLMAAKKSTLIEHDIRFDQQFKFHFYDMDFCRSVRAKGLRLGTWPICATHQSKGAFGTDEWRAMQILYASKWEESSAPLS